MELQCKPDFEQAMKRVAAWFEHELLDRPPVRFSEHNADFAGSHTLAGRTWPDLKSRWFDAEFQVDFFIESHPRPHVSTARPSPSSGRTWDPTCTRRSTAPNWITAKSPRGSGTASTTGATSREAEVQPRQRLLPQDRGTDPHRPGEIAPAGSWSATPICTAASTAPPTGATRNCCAWT